MKYFGGYLLIAILCILAIVPFMSALSPRAIIAPRVGQTPREKLGKLQNKMTSLILL